MGDRFILQARVKNIIAIAYVIVLYSLGIVSITSVAWQLNLLGVVAIAHSLVISAVLTHEFIHGNIFKNQQLDAFWGQVMTHFNGACYAPWKTIVDHHFTHHLQHVDVIGFNLNEYFNRVLPTGLRWIYQGLEWLYLPVLEFEMRWRIMLAPFFDLNKQQLLGRTILLMIYRASLFCLLAWISWRAILLYLLAYICFVNMMRFIDAFHHTYEYAIIGTEFPQRDRLYEQANTFSNLISTRYPWLNLLILNFCYHNAHHYQMNCPWHELPKLHAKLYHNQGHELLPSLHLIRNYHRFRLTRLSCDQGNIMQEGKLNLDRFVGAVGVSLLTPP